MGRRISVTGCLWRKAAAHGHVRSGGAGSTGVRNTGVKSLAGEANCKVSGLFSRASAKSVAEFETFVAVACLRPGFADVAERPAVHDWKFATRVEWLKQTLGFEPRLASPIKNRWPAVLSRAATAVVSAHCGPLLWTIQAAAGPKPPRAARAGEGAPSYRSW